MKSFKIMKRLLFVLALGLLGMSQTVAATTFRYAEGTPNRGISAEALQFFAGDLTVEQSNKMGLGGQGIWDQYTALVRKYEAERDERGYPWDR